MFFEIQYQNISLIQNFKYCFLEHFSKASEPLDNRFNNYITVRWVKMLKFDPVYMINWCIWSTEISYFWLVFFFYF